MRDGAAPAAVVALPASLGRRFATVSSSLKLRAGALKLEPMIEAPHAVIGWVVRDWRVRGYLTARRMSRRSARAIRVQRAWKTPFDDISHSLAMACYQGRDRHAAQLPICLRDDRRVFHTRAPGGSRAARAFVGKAPKPRWSAMSSTTRRLDRALLNFFVRGLNAGALTMEVARETGITAGKFQHTSCAKILAGRRTRS